MAPAAARRSLPHTQRNQTQLDDDDPTLELGSNKKS